MVRAYWRKRIFNFGWVKHYYYMYTVILKNVYVLSWIWLLLIFCVISIMARKLGLCPLTWVTLLIFSILIFCEFSLLFSKFRAEKQKTLMILTINHSIFLNIIAIRALVCVSNLITYNENEFEIFLHLFVSICVGKICHNFYYF